MLDLQTLYQFGVAILLVLSPVTFTVLFFKTAPYGRHKRKIWGPNLNPRLGWVIMEIPSVVLFALTFFHLETGWSQTTLFLLILWEMHYVQRTFVYSALLRSSSTAMPLVIIAMGFAFNLINAPLNAIGLFYLPTSYSSVLLPDPFFLIGISLFILGFVINLHSDHILRKLRQPLETEYKLPRGGLFRWVTSPNYLGEIIEWVGWMIAAQSLASVAFAAFTFANLAPRAQAHHNWYLANFPDYPKNRKALFPWVF